MRPLVKIVPSVVLVACVVSGCVSPAWDDHDYGLKAGASAQAVASNVEIVRLAVRDHAELTSPYLKSLLTQAVEDIGNVNQQFGGVQPPSDVSDRLRTQVTDLTTEAEDEVQDLLIQVRRNGLRDPAQAETKLGKLAEKLRAIEEAHR
ncbi:hypothetical protein [Sphaerisporangium fuscum]|uniref:hypothetical protein n=1 Tax=Sphaerisporangium fuscum TaxID=2835868 RepID=UPI001BDD6E0C|nr:hypothetical protein [Sphaerisporangium fuscum]